MAAFHRLLEQVMVEYDIVAERARNLQDQMEHCRCGLGSGLHGAPAGATMFSTTASSHVSSALHLRPGSVKTVTLDPSSMTSGHGVSLSGPLAEAIVNGSLHGGSSPQSLNRADTGQSLDHVTTNFFWKSSGGMSRDGSERDMSEFTSMGAGDSVSNASCMDAHSHAQDSWSPSRAPVVSARAELAASPPPPPLSNEEAVWALAQVCPDCDGTSRRTTPADESEVSAVEALHHSSNGSAGTSLHHSSNGSAATSRAVAVSVGGAKLASSREAERRDSLASQGVPSGFKRISYFDGLVSPDALSGRSCTINPEQSTFLQRWDILCAASLAFVAVVAPVQVAMLPTKVDALFIISCCVDVIFLGDLILNFFIMFQRRTNFGFSWEHRHSQIIARYLRTWFAIDFVSILPFDLLSLLSASDAMVKMKAIKAIRLLRLLKLARMLRAGRVFQRFEVRTSVSYGKLSLMKFFTILLVITHWLACFWALTLILVDETEGVPRWIDVFDEQEKNVSVKTRDTAWKLYLACLYFTSYTITSVGYGDIGPVNIVERVTSTLMIIFAGISWAVVLGQVCGIVANLDSDEQTFRSNMDELNTMMSDRLLPGEMRQRLRSFFLSNKTAQRRQRHHRLIECMSPGLQGEVVMLINDRWISHFSLLRQMRQAAKGNGRDAPFFSMFIVQISRKMDSVVHAQQELFGLPQVLYILNRGLVSRGQRVLQTGSVWGKDFVLSDKRLIDLSQSYSLTYVELTVITRFSFFSVAERFDMCRELQRRIRRYVCWLAVQRGLWREARRRLRSQQRRAGRTSVRSQASQAVSAHYSGASNSGGSEHGDGLQDAAAKPFESEGAVLPARSMVSIFTGGGSGLGGMKLGQLPAL